MKCVDDGRHTCPVRRKAPKGPRLCHVRVDNIWLQQPSEINDLAVRECVPIWMNLTDQARNVSIRQRVRKREFALFPRCGPPCQMTRIATASQGVGEKNRLSSRPANIRPRDHPE